MPVLKFFSALQEPERYAHHPHHRHAELDSASTLEQVLTLRGLAEAWPLIRFRVTKLMLRIKGMTLQTPSTPNLPPPPKATFRLFPLWSVAFVAFVTFILQF